MALIHGANTLSAAGYDVANSCRINRADDGDFNFTPGGAGNGQKYTLSFWIKGSLTSNYMFFATAGGNESAILIDGSNAIQVYEHNGSSFVSNIITNRVLRDVAAWYHIVVAVDTTQSTDTNRVKIYINGAQETSYATSSLPAEDASSLVFNTTNKHYVTNNAGGGAVNGYVAEVVFINDAQLAPTSFGEFDEDSPTIWKPIDVSGLTPGTNGFYLDFEASDNLGNDAFGGTDLTENGIVAADQATDTPTNNFCTMNPLAYPVAGTLVFSEGNCNVATTVGEWKTCFGTLAVSSGKWYFEYIAHSAANIRGGFSSTSYLAEGGTTAGTNSWGTAVLSRPSYQLSQDGALKSCTNAANNQTQTGYATNMETEPSIVLTTIVGVYLDLDNNKIYIAEAGTVQNSGTGFDVVAGEAYVPSGSHYTPTGAKYNFGGCPPLSISSGNTDANGYGNFEYDPSAGSFDGASKDFYALCTKNLAEYG